MGILMAAGLVAMAGCSADDSPDSAPTPSDSRTAASGTIALSTPRAVHQATVLGDGRVLITGGCTLAGCGGFDQGRTSEVYDPSRGAFTRGAAMTSPRAGHTATLLADGRVLVAGGYPGEGRAALRSAEVFDPRSSSFRAVASMSTGRADHTASLLPDGRVLIAGGTTNARTPLATTEYFDPSTGRFTVGGDLRLGRTGHAAVSTPHGLLLVGGTSDGDTAQVSTDLSVGSGWQPGPPLLTARVKHAAVGLPDGRVLVVGGSTTTEGRELLDTTEILDVRVGRSTPGPRLSEGQYKLAGAVAELTDGRVVIAGGQRIDVFDPANGRITVVGGDPVPRRSFVTASPLSRDRVLVAGGYDIAIVPGADARVVRLPPPT